MTPFILYCFPLNNRCDRLHATITYLMSSVAYNSNEKEINEQHLFVIRFYLFSNQQKTQICRTNNNACYKCIRRNLQMKH